MRKMLGIVGSLVLCSAAAWGETEAPTDRSALSYDENVVINTVCAKAQKQGDKYLSVLRRAAARRAQGSPDPGSRRPHARQGPGHRSEMRSLPPCRTWRVQRLRQAGDRRQGAGYAEGINDDELAPSFAKFLRDDSADRLQATPIAVTDVVTPADVLPKLTDHLENKELSAQDVFRKVKHSVFVVVAAHNRADLHQLDAMLGSAVAISDHLLLTNCHVVKDRSIIKIGQEDLVNSATLVGADYKTDRCVLKSEKLTLTPIAGVRPLDSLTVGEHAFAVGTPNALELTLSEGLVSSVRHLASRNLVQTSAPISPGSSGGGLFDDRGNLIGITTLGSFGHFQNLNFAIAAVDFWNR